MAMNEENAVCYQFEKITPDVLTVCSGCHRAKVKKCEQMLLFIAMHY